jgi:tetratricopeptide (TPR) repeat protein
MDPPEYAHAAELVQHQQWNDALQVIRPLLAEYPDSPKLLNLEGLALLGAGESDSARHAFEQALALNPTFAPASKNLAILEWTTGAPRAAADTKSALSLNPTDAVLNSYGALAAIERRDAQTALLCLNKAGSATALLPPDLEYRLGLQLAEQGLYRESIPLLQHVLATRGGSWKLRYNLALAQFRAGEFRASIDSLAPLSTQSASSDTLNLLAQAYQKAGEPQQAVDTFRKAITADPLDDANYLDLAALCVDNGALDKAVEVIQAGLDKNPRSTRLHFQLGLLYVLSHNYETAQASFERSAALEPQNDLPRAGMQLATLQENHVDQAIAGLRQQVKERPESAMLWYLLGSALTHGGAPDGSAEQQEAESAYRKALALDPNLAWPYVELGKIYIRQKRPAEAVPLLEKAVQMNVDARPAYYQLAIAFRELNQPDRSKEMLTKVQSLNAREHDSH